MQKKRRISKESMTDSYKIKNSVIEWLKIIEMKIFVDDGMLLRMKITLAIWPHKKISTFRANGGLIQTCKVLILCHWGIDLVSSRHCLLCNLQQEAGEEPQVLTFLLQTPTMGGTQFILHMVKIGKVHGGLRIIPKVKTEMHQVLSERGDLLLAVFEKFFGKRLSWIQVILLQIDRLQLAAVYCNRRRCKHNTSNDPFSRCKSVQQLATEMNDDHRIQSDYKYKSELQNQEGEKSVFGITSAWWHRARHEWQRDHQDPGTPSTQRTWTLTRECAVLLFVSQVRVVMIHIAPHGSSVAHVISSTNVMSVSLRPWVLHSLLLPHLPIHPLSLALPPALLPLLWGS